MPRVGTSVSRILAFGSGARRAYTLDAQPVRQAAEQLLDVEREAALVRDAALDAFRHELQIGLVGLEVTVAAAFLHRLDRAHAAVELIGAALEEDRLAGALLGAGEEAA